MRGSFSAMVASLLVAGSATAHPAHIPPNDPRAAAIEVQDLPFTDHTSTLLATSDGTTPCGDNLGPLPAAPPDVWYRFTPAEAMRVLIYTSAAWDTMLVVWSGSTLVGCNDDSASGAGARDSRLIVSVTAGTSYEVQLDGFSPSSQLDRGEVTLHLLRIA